MKTISKNMKILVLLILVCNTNFSFGQFVPKEVKGAVSKIKKRSVDNISYYDLTNSLPKNHKRDGSIDYTSYLQSAILKYKKVTMPPFPILTTGLRIASESIIVFKEGSSLIMKPTSSEFYNILLIEGVNNVQIINPTLIGDRDSHIGKTGEWGYGINILCSSNVSILKADISKCWGDAIVISDTKSNLKNGLDYGSKNIEVIDFVLNHNRRDGISILGGQDILISNGKIYNTMGTPPKAAIMIEPNQAINNLRNVTLKNLILINNVIGIGVNLDKFSNARLANTIELNISNITIENNTIGIQIAGYNKSKPNKRKIEGYIDIRNIKTKNVGKLLVRNEAYGLYPSINIKTFFDFDNGKYSSNSLKVLKNVVDKKGFKLN